MLIISRLLPLIIHVCLQRAGVTVLELIFFLYMRDKSTISLK